MFLIWTLKLEDAKSITKRILKRLRYDKRTSKDVVNILSTLDIPIEYDIAPYIIKKTMGNIGIKNTLTMLNLKELSGYNSDNIEKLKEIALDILKQKHPIFKSQLKLNGHDIWTWV